MCSTQHGALPPALPQGALPGFQALPSTLRKPQHSPSTVPTVTSTGGLSGLQPLLSSSQPACSQAHSTQVHSSPSPLHTWQAICSHPGLHVHHSSHPNAPQHGVWGAPPSQLKSSCPVQQLEEVPRAPPAPWGLEVSSQQGCWGRGRFPRHLSQASGRTGLKAKPISCTSNSAPHSIPVFLETGQPTTPPLGSHQL